MDSAIAQGAYQSHDSYYTRAKASERLEDYKRTCVGADADVMVRAVTMSDLQGIVNPQFDAARVSRGIYDNGVTTRLLNRYPIWAEGDSLTLPRVTVEADADTQNEGQDYHDTDVNTSPVKADLFTVSAKSEISFQAIERGNMSLELLSDEMNRCLLYTSPSPRDS